MRASTASSARAGSAACAATTGRERDDEFFDLARRDFTGTSLGDAAASATVSACSDVIAAGAAFPAPAAGNSEPLDAGASASLREAKAARVGVRVAFAERLAGAGSVPGAHLRQQRLDRAFFLRVRRNAGHAAALAHHFGHMGLDRRAVAQGSRGHPRRAVAALVLHRGPADVVAALFPGALQIFHAVGEVGVGVEQRRGRPGKAERAGGRRLDLAEPHGAAADGPRIVAAFDPHHGVGQRRRQAVFAGMPLDHPVDGGAAGDRAGFARLPGLARRDLDVARGGLCAGRQRALRRVRLGARGSDIRRED